MHQRLHAIDLDGPTQPRTERRTANMEMSKPEVVPPSTAFVIDLSGTEDVGQKGGMSLGDCAQKHLMRRSTSRNKQRLIVADNFEENTPKILKVIID